MAGFGDYLRSKGYKSHSETSREYPYFFPSNYIRPRYPPKQEMKRSNPYLVKTSKAERFAKIARNPNAYSNRMAIVPYQPRRTLPQQRKKIEELKGVGGNLDLTAGNLLATTNTNGSSFVINLIQPGNGSFNRVGRKVNLTTLRLKGIIDHRCDATGSMEQNTVRMVVVWDKQPSSGAIPSYDLIFGETDQSGTEGSGFLFNVRYDNTARFSVVKDCIFTSKFNNLSAASSWQESFDEYINLKGRETVFSGQSVPQTIADISTGALYVYFRAEANAASIRSSVVNSTYRLRYFD